MNRAEFDRALREATSEDQRIAWFGALLTQESGLEGRLIIVGGSAIEVYLTSNAYVSQDIDVVGDKSRIVPVLKRWGFRRVAGRDERVYWMKTSLGQVDLVGESDRSGLAPRRERTRYGTVLLGPVEPLIVRRLTRAARERSTELFRQAEVLATRFSRSLDWEYIEAEAAYEKVLPLYGQLRQQVLGS